MNRTYNKIIYLFFITLFLFKGVESCAQLKKSDIDKAIEISKLEHPYLYFNENEKEVLLDRIKTDHESNNVLVATLILPISNKNKINEILEPKSISSKCYQDLKISFIYKNKTYKYEYKLTENGYSIK